MLAHMASGLGGHGVSTKVIEMLEAFEVCALRQVSKHLRRSADGLLKRGSHVHHRAGIDPEPSRWLRPLIANGFDIQSIVLVR